MKLNVTKQILVTIVVIILPLLSACFTIIEVDQPEAANVNTEIEVYLSVRTEGTDANPHYGIIGLLLPNDWTVNLVIYSGDFGPDTCSFLHPDSIDGDVGGKVDYWTDSLEVRYPSGDNMQWVVYQANTPYASSLDTGYVDVKIKMTTGAAGTFKVGYFVSNAALDFTDPSFYSISLNHPIQVGGTEIENGADRKILNQFRLLQNYPNPFNPTTTIAFDLPVAAKTTLKIYNLLGEEVATLVNGDKVAGSHKVIFDASNLKSGIYYYKLQSGDFSAVKKLVLTK